MKLLSGEFKPGHTVEADVEKSAIVFRAKKAKPEPVEASRN
jgi:hypothetical protein